ncbi:MAG TPA: RNA polymerase sigma factor SigJ [Longimicrobium sp.]|nr:RNA polymerase sigma factor SigJ [Longimicrobium sp.]
MTVLDPSATEPDVLRHRPRLLGLGYRMLGDLHEAEDLVQEAYLRWFQADRDQVQSPEAWLLTVVSRLAVDRLRRAATARQTYVGPWLPEPVATDASDRDVERAQDLSIAMLMMLERLSPEERAAFLLREVFDTGYGEIARILDRTEPAVRKMVQRARDRVRDGQARFSAPPDVHGELLQRFLDALARDDRDGVLSLMAPDVTFTSDGGGKVWAARRLIVGDERVARMLLALERKYGPAVRTRIVRVNGDPAVATFHGDELVHVTAIATDGERITSFYRVLNPDKLGHVTSVPVKIE